MNVYHCLGIGLCVLAAIFLFQAIKTSLSKRKIKQDRRAYDAYRMQQRVEALRYEAERASKR